jgi:hypothetical protein
VGATVTGVPMLLAVGCAPLQSPLAEQVAAPVEDHVSVALSPARMAVGLTLMATVGGPAQRLADSDTTSNAIQAMRIDSLFTLSSRHTQKRDRRTAQL